MSHTTARSADLAYRVASDPHWMTAGSTATATASGRGPRATVTRAPLNLSVYELADMHRRDLANFVHRHPDAAPTLREEFPTVPTGRAALSVYAAAVAHTTDAARHDYDTLQLVSTLRTAMEIGDAEDILGKIRCPGCSCWSLLPVRPGGVWRAACLNVNCAPEPGTPRTWSLIDVAHHHIADMAA